MNNTRNSLFKYVAFEVQLLALTGFCFMSSSATIRFVDVVYLAIYQIFTQPNLNATVSQQLLYIASTSSMQL